MSLVALRLIAMRTQKLQIGKVIRTAPRKREDMIKLIGEKDTVTVRIQPAIDASIMLCLAQIFNILGRKIPSGTFFSGAVAFGYGPALVRVLTAIFSRLAVGFFAVGLAALSFVGNMAHFTKTGQPIFCRCAIEKLGVWLDCLTPPATFLSRCSQLFLGPPVFFSIGIPQFLTAGFAAGLIPVRARCLLVKIGEWFDCLAPKTSLFPCCSQSRPFGNTRVLNFLAAGFTARSMTICMPSMFVEFRQWFEDMAARTQFHLASVRKSVFQHRGQVGTEILLFGSGTLAQGTLYCRSGILSS